MITIIFIISLLLVNSCQFGMVASPEPQLSDIDRISLEYHRDADFIDAMDDYIYDCIENNCDITQADQQGNNLFHWAVSIDSRTVCRNLEKLLSYAKSREINIKPLLNAKNAVNLTPLHIAAKAGSKRQVQDLLDEGAEINALGQEYMNALEVLFDVSREPFKSLEMIILLLSTGGKVRAQYAANAHEFMQNAYPKAKTWPICLYGDPAQDYTEKEKRAQTRLDMLNFVSLLLEKENRKSYLSILPPSVFGLSFSYIYNFYTDRSLCDLNPFNSSNKS
ncbi:hypothetical protein BH09DEP1_BH09DEP1_2650 [soil metagenome]